VRATPIASPRFTPGSRFFFILLSSSSSSSFAMDPMQAFENLQAQVAQLQAEVQFLRSNSTTPSRPKPSLPDPEKFNGYSHKFDTWLPSIKVKLRVDSAAIGDTVAQFYYVYLNLDSSVQAMVLPQLG
jgi:hypothetical protein